MNYLASTHLWIGPSEKLVSSIIKTIQQEYCPVDSCGACTICKQIIACQHHAYLSLSTVKSVYSRSDFDIVFEKIAFQRDANEPFFCVIQQAEKLSPVTAPTLLKVLEEPPIGWHWFLLTNRPQEIVPTIASRCIIKEFSSESVHESTHELYTFFTSTPLADSITFQQIFDRLKISEYESRLLLDRLIQFFITLSRTKREFMSIADFLQTSLIKLPMPGSSKFFWRTVYLAMICLLSSHEHSVYTKA